MYNRKRLTFEKLEPYVLLANGTAVVEITSNIANVQPSERVDISVRYRLSGNSKSGPWDVKELALYEEDPVSDDRIASTTTRISQQSTWFYHTFKNIRLSSYDDGGNGIELYARVSIDDNTFNGQNATDRSPVRKVTVGQPDLQVTSLKVSDATVESGDKIEIDAIVKNNGNADGGRTKVQYYFGPSAGSRQTYIGEGVVPNIGILSPGEQAEDSPTALPQPNFEIPNVASGTYYITAVADADREVTESNENNNERSVSLVVDGTQADLKVTSLLVSHDRVSPGDKIEIDAVVRNDGDADAKTSTVEYFFGPSRGSRQVRIGEGIVPNFGKLSPGEEAKDSPTALPQPNFEIPVVDFGTYYITAVADADREIAESDEDNNSRSVEIRVGTVVPPTIDNRFVCSSTTGAGVTVITHGFAGGSGRNATTPDWTVEMAEAILERSDGGSLFVHDPVSGDWVLPTERGLPEDDWKGRRSLSNSNLVDEEIVLVFDWTRESDDSEFGWQVAAADSLFASLVAPFSLGNQTIDLLSRPIHFIGHSRGTIVNTLAAERLGWHFPAHSIAQFTTLDPHPSVIHGDPGALQQQLSIPNNILYADNYYRQDGTYEADLDFNGVEVIGARNMELDEDVLSANTGSLFEHSDVHVWYLSTIKPNSPFAEDYAVGGSEYDDWWVAGRAWNRTIEPLSGRLNVGYARSRIGGGELDTDQMQHHRLRSPSTPETIFNGNFERGDAFANEIPGWERHGGGGPGNLNTIGSSDNQYLQLSTFGSSRRHNDMYIPPSATDLVFDYWINNNDGLNSNDVLEVFIGDEVIDSISLRSETDGFVRDRAAEIPTAYSGAVTTLGFRIGGTGGIDSEVRIDNVRLSEVKPGPTRLEQLDMFHQAVVQSNSGIQSPDDFLATCVEIRRGDANADQRVDFRDFLIVSAHFGRTEPSKWSDGDANFDGKVNFSDFLYVSNNFGSVGSNG